MKIGVVQLNVGPDPKDNLIETTRFISAAVAEGAEVIFTPEVTNLIETDHARQQQVLFKEEDDPTLGALSALAAELKVTLQIGSLALKTDDPDGRFANRGFLISPEGSIMARYDKIHMFDVALSKSETFRESARYRPGNLMVLGDAQAARIGLSICYDLRFPYLYRQLAQEGAEILTVPSAFAQTTGKAHWHILLRARAIETGCFVVAAAQTGTHSRDDHALRQTYGHSLVVDPWGEVLVDMGEKPGYGVTEIDLQKVSEAQSRIPAIFTDVRIEQDERD